MNKPFRLESVLKLRSRERDFAGKEVADAKAAIALLDSKLQEIAIEQRQMEMRRRPASDGKVSLNQILDAERYQLVLAAQYSHLLNDRSLLVQELERRQANLVTRQQAVKALEKLKQVHHDQAADLLLKREQSAMDEWSQVQHSSDQRRNP